MRFRRHRSKATTSVEQAPETAWQGEAFTRFSTAVEMPMLILALVMVPVLIIPLVDKHLPSKLDSTLQSLDYFIWGLFLLEYLIKLTLAPAKRTFVRQNIPDLVVVAVPMLRPLRLIRSIRALRLLRLTRLSAFAGEGVQKQRSLHSKAVNYVLFVVMTLVLVCSVMVLDLERDVHAANIKTFPDALWWAVVTVTTVGYGDRYPVTAGARAVAAILMFAGIALVGVLTAGIAAYFVQHASARSKAEESEDNTLQEVLARLTAIESLLAGQQPS
jgi:voltage-gated potassium channel